MLEPNKLDVLETWFESWFLLDCVIFQLSRIMQTKPIQFEYVNAPNGVGDSADLSSSASSNQLFPTSILSQLFVFASTLHRQGLAHA